MTLLNDKFGVDGHIFLPVIHVANAGQALWNARLAFDSGADGIFLINHDTPADHLLEVYKKVKGSLPGFWIGVNCLDLGLGGVSLMPDDTEGIWVDNCGIDDDGLHPAYHLYTRARRLTGWDGLLFGGIDFKHQKPVADLAKVASFAKDRIEVITTSGPATGRPPSVEKIKTIRAAIGDHPLAIASGITAENVRNYLDYADCFLVATGISDSHTELSEVKTKDLARKIGK